MTRKKYFGDSPKAAKNFPCKYSNATDSEYSAAAKQQYLPTARELAEYDAVFEGAAERIIKLTEKEQAQRHAWENKALCAQNAGRRLGQFLFAMVLVAAIYAGVSLVNSQHEIIAIALIILICSTVISAICLNNKQRFSSERRNHFIRKQHHRQS